MKNKSKKSKKGRLKEIVSKKVVIFSLSSFLLGIVIAVLSIIIFNSSSAGNILNINCEDNKNLSEFISVYETIVNNYYDDVDETVLVEGAISGLLNSLDDPYTTYMDKDETKAFEERMQGDYEGIGAYVGLDADGNLIISQPFTSSPAEKAGLKAMDIILEIDGVSTEGMSTETAVSLIKGKAGTSVVLKISRKDVNHTISIKRDTITIHSVSHEMLANKVGYIYIEMFSENVYDEFEEALLDLEDQKMKSLIIDVRSNSGGYLNEVSEILSLFLGKGEVIYQLASKDEVYKVKSTTGEYRKYDVVVLQNEYSASASEILAAGLSESYGATLVGKTSYGKGLVQTPAYIETGGMIKYSNQKWLTPNGNWIHKKGIKPDYEVDLSKEYFENPSDSTDNQLQKAINLLSE